MEALEIINLHVGQMCLSSITLAEMFYGAEKCAMPDPNLRRIEDFIQ